AGHGGLELAMPTAVIESAGSGLVGEVEGRAIGVGSLSWLMPTAPPAWARQARRRADIEGSLAVFLTVERELVAALLFDDPIRPDAARMIRTLRRAGIERTVLVSGDRADVATMIASLVGIDRVEAERDPSEKVQVVLEEAANGPTIMVGDGVNDAPALAAASVGVAVAARGASAASEAADVVLVVDRIDALADAMRICARSRRIAAASVGVGMGLSLIAMGLAAVGILTPVAGAVLQEVIDVLAIGVALLALIPVRAEGHTLSPHQTEVVSRLFAEHNSLKDLVERVRGIADALPDHDADMAPVRELLQGLEQEQIPHERAEEDELYPLISRSLGGRDPMAMMSRSHTEIEHQVKRLHRIVDGIGDDQPCPEDIIELRRVLYGLYAVLRLHNSQEEDVAFSMLRQ
ncbi:MAG: heavy metal translocating P-type ATPase, partial [Actinomycetes bacterium]